MTPGGTPLCEIHVMNSCFFQVQVPPETLFVVIAQLGGIVENPSGKGWDKINPCRQYKY
jgi:hypothetical protein